MESGTLIALGGLILAFIAYAVGATVYVSRIELACQRALDAYDKLMRAVIAAEVTKESKARHDLAGLMQRQVDSLDRDYRAVRDQMVHKTDLAAVEMRITSSIDKLEDRLYREPTPKTKEFKHD